MNPSIWNKQIPGLLFLFLFMLSFVAVQYITKNNFTPFGKASASVQPINVQVTNVQDTSVSISYETTIPTYGSISYGKANNGKTNIHTKISASSSLDKSSYDDRDRPPALGKYQIHYFTIKNLSPNTTYAFKILSNNNSYDNNGIPFSITTISTLTTQPIPQIIQGNVVFPASVLHEAIVYATASGSQPISALVTKDGAYRLDTGIMLTQRGDIYSKPATPLYMLIQGDSMQTTLQLSSSTSQVVPSVALGTIYDFSQSGSLSEATTSAIALPSVPVQKVVQTKVQIISPEQGQAFNEQQPLFSGTAAPRSVVTVQIHSITQFNTSVEADSFGDWEYTPPTNLTPGQHTITITAVDAFGIVHTLSSTFYVYSSGAQFLEPSVAISPSPTQETLATNTPTTTPINITPTATISVSNTPTAVFTNTPTVIPPATFTPTQIAQSTSTPSRPPLLNSGSNSAIMSVLVALIPVILGMLLVYLSKGVIR